MRNGGLLHPELNLYLSLLGHTDRFCIADAGLPIPDAVPRIDLAFAPGKPSFRDVYEAVTGVTVIDKAFCAEEAPEEMRRSFQERLGPGCVVTALPHEELKALVGSVRFVVRTGECTPYANIILQSGVFF